MRSLRFNIILDEKTINRKIIRIVIEIDVCVGSKSNSIFQRVDLHSELNVLRIAVCYHSSIDVTLR